MAERLRFADDVDGAGFDVEPSDAIGVGVDAALKGVVDRGAVHWVGFVTHAGVVIARDGTGLVKAHAEVIGFVVGRELEADSARVIEGLVPDEVDIAVGLSGGGAAHRRSFSKKVLAASSAAGRRWKEPM